MAELSNSRVLVGGKVLIKMDGRTVGFANEADCTDNYGMQPIHILGQLQAIEYVPTVAQHSISMSVMVLRDTSLIDANLEPNGAGNFGFLGSAQNTLGSALANTSKNMGSATAEQLQSSVKGATGSAGALRVLHGKTFDIEISQQYMENNAPVSTALVTYKNCYFNSGTVRVGANAIVVHQCQFVALDRDGTLSNSSGGEGVTVPATATNNTTAGVSGTPVGPRDTRQE
jgi:hypothetical protein